MMRMHICAPQINSLTLEAPQAPTLIFNLLVKYYNLK